MVFRRNVLAGAVAAGGLAALPRFAIAQGAAARTIRFVPQANLSSLDPIWTTATVTRNLRVPDLGHAVRDRRAAPPAAADGGGARR